MPSEYAPPYRDCQGKMLISFRRVAQNDAKRMLRWVSDPEIREGLGLLSKPSLAKTHIWIANATNSKVVYAIAIELNGIHVGNVVLDKIDLQIKSARLSIYIGEACARGAGVGRESVQHALRVAFHELKMSKVWLTVHCRNIAAIKTYLKCGFSIEDILVKEFTLSCNAVDGYRMGILATDFEAKG